MKLIILLGVLLFSTGYADEVPLRDSNDASIVIYDIQPIYAHELSPITGRGMDEKTYVAIAQRLASAEYERNELRSQLSMKTTEGIKPTTTALFVFLGLAVGIGLGILAAR